MKSIHPRFLTFTLAALLSAASASALAQSVPEPAPGGSAPAASTPTFISFDSNSDGKISLKEFKAQGGNEQAFTDTDANKDKNLSKDEFSKLGKPSTKSY
jgi:hypothetical protein